VVISILLNPDFRFFVLIAQHRLKFSKSPSGCKKILSKAFYSTVDNNCYLQLFFLAWSEERDQLHRKAKQNI